MIQWMKQLQAHFSLRKLAMSTVGLVTMVSILAFVVYEVTKVEVSVETDEEAISVYTHASTVGEVLKEQSIEAGEHDLVEPSVGTAVNEAMTIEYREAQEITVSLDDDTYIVWTTAYTVGELMAEIDVEVSEHDLIEPSMETELSEGLDVTFAEAFQVHLSSDGEEDSVWTTSTTVADFLEDEDVALGELDRVEPSEDEDLKQETDVNVIRVEKVTDVVEETVDFATVTQNDSSMEQGSEEVEQQGREGKIEKHYEVVFEDGEEVSRELIKEEKVQESKDRIVTVGTKQPTETVSRGSSSSDSSSSSSGSSSSGSSSSGSSSESAANTSGSSSGGSWQTFTATAYTAYCNGCSGVTATGIDLRANPDANVIAVDPSVIPLGSRVEVKGHGIFIAGDTGGAIQGRKIDIFMSDKSRVQSFGRQTVEIRVLD